MSKMTEVLTKTIMDGHREQIILQIVEQLTESHEYEEYVSDCIENVLAEMFEEPENKDAKQNVLREGINRLVCEI